MRPKSLILTPKTARLVRVEITRVTTAGNHMSKSSHSEDDEEEESVRPPKRSKMYRRGKKTGRRGRLCGITS